MGTTLSSKPLIAITGVNGFLGSHLWRNLLNSAGCGLVCNRAGDFFFFHSEKVTRYETLNDFFSENSYSEIILYHCATKFENTNNPNSLEDLIQGNFRYPFELVKNFSKFGEVHFVNLNSYWQALENTVGNTRSNYAISKNLLLFNLESVISSENVTNFFLYDTYGPGDTRQKLIPTLVRCLVEKSSLDVSNPLSEINLSHVSDVVGTIEKMGQEKVGGKFQISHPRTLRVRDVIEVFTKISGHDFGRGLTRSMTDFSKVLPLKIAEIPTSWNPKVDLEDGLRLIIQSVDVR